MCRRTETEWQILAESYNMTMRPRRHHEVTELIVMARLEFEYESYKKTRVFRIRNLRGFEFIVAMLNWRNSMRCGFDFESSLN